MKRLPVILGLVVLIAFGFGLVRLLNLRFERGDSYPPYSSLRADPLGSKALFESLDALIPARRNLQPLSKLVEGRDTTLLWLGADSSEARFQPEDYRQFDAFVRTGGRLIFSFRPVPRKPLPNSFRNAASRRGGRGLASSNAPPISTGPNPEEPSGIPIGTQWDFTLAFVELPKDDQRQPFPVAGVLRATGETPTLPLTLPIHTTLCFDPLTPDWRVIYGRPGATNSPAVLAERRFGKGSIVLVADSYPFSNEALLRDREAGLLAWFTGKNRNVVFDETHLGVRESPGIATLARKYRLHGLFAALLVLAALFIWKNATSLLPPHEEQLAREHGEVLEGKDSAAGFVNLLRRSIPPADLLKVCLEQWNAHSAGTRKPASARLEAMQQIIDAQNALEPKQRDPVATYQRLSQVLSARFEFRGSSFNVKHTDATHQREP